MLNLVLFGPPGAGKGTQAAFLANEFNLIHISTGDLLRQEIAAQTELGILADRLISKGELAPDEVVISMIEGLIKKNKKVAGYLFDGFPRTVNQAVALDRMLMKYHTRVAEMLCLVVERQELIDRLYKRGQFSGRSDDRDIATIEHRIDVYNEKTAPLIAYYQKQKKYFPVEGVGPIEEIAENLKNAVKQLKKLRQLLA